jgi:hypothetical protein
MRFLVSMKMPNANGMLTHQLTLEHPSNSVEELCSAMNRDEFLIFHLFYKRTQMSGEVWWQDRGPIIINTSCVGKVQEFLDLDNSFEDQSKEAAIIRTRNQRYSK